MLDVAQLADVLDDLPLVDPGAIACELLPLGDRAIDLLSAALVCRNPHNAARLVRAVAHGGLTPTVLELSRRIDLVLVDVPLGLERADICETFASLGLEHATGYLEQIIARADSLEQTAGIIRSAWKYFAHVCDCTGGD